MKAALVIALAALTLAPLSGARQSAATRPDTIWVAVNVLHKDGQLVTDLTANDFEVEVNGQKREVAVFRNDAVPIALAIMVDISSSMETNYGLVRRAVTALTTHFEPGDRAILGSFSSLPWISPRFSGRPEVLQRSVAEALGGSLSLCDGDWIDKTKLVGQSEQSKQSYGPVNMFSRRLAIRGGSAIWDGAACGVNAVASDGETPRRIVVLMTDGVDNISSSTAASVIDRANRYGVMIYAVSVMGGYGMAGGELKGIAEATGGGYFHLTGEDKVAGAFARIGEELRRQYVIGVTSTDSPAGPQRIVVRSTALDTSTRFRRVFMESAAASPLAAAGAVRAPAVAPPPAALPPGLTVDDRALGFGGVAAATPEAPGSGRTPVWDDLDRFLQPEFTSGVAARLTIADLRSILALLRRSGTRWIEAAGAAEKPRRRLAAAAFVLDLLYTQNDPYLWQNRQPNPDLIDWAASALEAGPSTPAERLWYFGAAALFERGGVTDSFDRFLTRALRRFPDEPRFVLARAVAQELQTWPEDRDDRTFALAPSVTALVVSRYETALKLPPVAFEAGLRLAFFDFRRGRTDAAIARLEALGDAPADDVVLGFWWRLLKGRALEQANRLPEAVASFEDALNDVPGASSARSALIAALARAGRQAEAARVAARALSTPAPPVDPWTIYVLPDMRFWSAVEHTLRRAVTR